MNVVSEIRWKPSYGLRIVAFWNWRYNLVHALISFLSSSWAERWSERSGTWVRALGYWSANVQNSSTLLRALGWCGTSARIRDVQTLCWYSERSLVLIRALGWQSGFGPDWVFNSKTGCFSHSLIFHLFLSDPRPSSFSISLPWIISKPCVDRCSTVFLLGFVIVIPTPFSLYRKLIFPFSFDDSRPRVPNLGHIIIVILCDWVLCQLCIRFSC